MASAMVSADGPLWLKSAYAERGFTYGLGDLRLDLFRLSDTKGQINEGST